MEHSAASTHRNDIRNELDANRAFLFRYAVIHLRDHELAQDLVQETLLAAVQAADRFRADASLRTWLVSILRHKIIDHVRKNANDPLGGGRADAQRSGPEDETVGDFFDRHGRWHGHMPQTWPDPDAALEDAQFWKIFQACCDVLPVQTAQVFLLREVMGFSVNEVCKDLRISTSNCSVMLYRARLRLQHCLERKWFMKSPDDRT